MIIDTHCHYNLEPLYAPATPKSWLDHWQRAQAAGVLASMIVGTSLETSKRALIQAANTSNLHASIGIHPYRVSEIVEQNTAGWEKELTVIIGKLSELVANPQVSAIGEIGLDYYWLSKSTAEPEQIKIAQKQLVTAQFKLATEQQLPVILHVRDKQVPEEATPGVAYWDMLEIIKQFTPLQQPVILHCVSGPVTYVSKAVELGCYIGVAGNCTYPSADSIRKLVQQAPKERILLETDAPYLPPQSNRGKICEPRMISETAEYLEKELGVPKAIILANTKRVFPTLIP